MEILHINLRDQKSWDQAHIRMKEVFDGDGVVIFPTDTVYGIGCSALREIAVQKIIVLKQREAAKPLPLFVRDMAQARSCASINKIQECFLKRAWPGSITAVLKKRPEVPKIITRNEETVGLRIPHFPFLNILMENIEYPIVQTSCNISGKEPCIDGEAAYTFFHEQSFQPDLIVDGGPSSSVIPSTVVDLVQLKILRQGRIPQEQIFEWWKECTSGK